MQIDYVAITSILACYFPSRTRVTLFYVENAAQTAFPEFSVDRGNAKDDRRKSTLSGGNGNP